ncbi:MAG: glycosyl transferase, partial [Phycisphaerae bacterium]
LGRDAWLVPTPGQTEQEYLAHHFSSKYAWQVIPQEDIVRELPERLAEHLAKSPSSHPHGTLR